jgi:hypothetical protein
MIPFGNVGMSIRHKQWRKVGEASGAVEMLVLWQPMDFGLADRDSKLKRERGMRRMPLRPRLRCG